ncbi:MAG: hypothetical protein J07HR59_01149 [Halorubrum sp. J07HR59]|nr:MAG: hypothetical protein J07HR59_01149 [Halorubrum sp. J07HR59]
MDAVNLKSPRPNSTIMSIEATEQPSVETLAEQLGQQITETEEYAVFEQAQANVETDEAVQEKIDEFEQIREEFMVARETGQATEAGLERVRDAQQELHAMPTMAAFLSAQEDLENRLDRLNEAISESLAVDFGGTASGCCQD